MKITTNTKFQISQMVKFNNMETSILSHGKIMTIEFDSEKNEDKYWINGEGWYFESQILGESEFEYDADRNEDGDEFTDAPY